MGIGPGDTSLSKNKFPPKKMLSQRFSLQKLWNEDRVACLKKKKSPFLKARLEFCIKRQLARDAPADPRG